jgi:ABC-type branched-subunit amino acid transport system permease subunit
MAAILPASTATPGEGRGRLIVWAALSCAVLALAGLWMPRWLSFLLTMAAANGLVSLGIVGLMRGGVVPFGQGMMFAAGGYAAALVYNHLGFTDALGMAVIGGAAAALIAAPFAPLLSRYRGIFFAMLTLALSMVTYGLLMKLDVLGGSDGFNVGRPTLFGQQLPDGRVVYTLYVLAIFLATAMALLARIFFDSTRGLVTLAVKENELRVEYLGGSVRQSMTINFILAAFCGGIGGALAVMALGHIEPNFSFWTTSGEFVFVAILAGWQSVAAVFVASTLLEVVRSFSSAYFPNTWQLVLGIFLLLVIRFLPGGIGSLWMGRKRQ